MGVPLHQKIAVRHVLSLTDRSECDIKVATEGQNDDEVFVHRYEDIMEAVLTDEEIISDVIEQMFESGMLTFMEDGGVYYDGRRLL